MENKAVECALKSLAWKALECASQYSVSDYEVAVESDGVKVIVRIVPTTASVQGLWLSSMEKMVLGVLRSEGKAIKGKVVAKRIGMSYNTQLKYVLLNMEERQLINHSKRDGYWVGDVGDIGMMAV